MHRMEELVGSKSSPESCCFKILYFSLYAVFHVHFSIFILFYQITPHHLQALLYLDTSEKVCAS